MRILLFGIPFIFIFYCILWILMHFFKFHSWQSKKLWKLYFSCTMFNCNTQCIHRYLFIFMKVSLFVFSEQPITFNVLFTNANMPMFFVFAMGQCRHFYFPVYLAKWSCLLKSNLSLGQKLVDLEKRYSSAFSFWVENIVQVTHFGAQPLDSTTSSPKPPYLRIIFYWL